MDKNIHKQTFEEIFQMNTQDENEKRKLTETSFFVTWNNFGEIFHHREVQHG